MYELFDMVDNFMNFSDDEINNLRTESLKEASTLKVYQLINAFWDTVIIRKEMKA